MIPSCAGSTSPNSSVSWTPLPDAIVSAHVGKFVNLEEIENEVPVIALNTSGSHATTSPELEPTYTRSLLEIQQRAEEVFFALEFQPSYDALSWCEHFHNIAEDFKQAAGGMHDRNVSVAAGSIYGPASIFYGRPNGAPELKLLESLGVPMVHSKPNTFRDRQIPGIISPSFSINEYVDARESDSGFPYIPHDVWLYDSRGPSWMPGLGSVRYISLDRCAKLFIN